MSERNKNMYKMYEDYKKTLKKSRGVVRRLQEENRKIRDKHKNPHRRQDHIFNQSDIAAWNSMIRELEQDMLEMEMYLEFDDRVLLHREYDNMKSMILNQNSNLGEIPSDFVFCESSPDISELLCSVELQEELVDLLGEVLTDRQKQILNMYYWEDMTQDEIATVLGVSRVTVTQSVSKSLERLKNDVDLIDLSSF